MVMRLFHSSAFNLYGKAKTSRFLILFLYHSTADLQIPPRPSSGHSTQDPANLAFTLLPNRRTISELNGVYARIIRTRLLESHPHPFYWNKIVRSYSKLSSPHTSLCIFITMLRASILPDSHSFSCIMKIVCQEEAIGFGLQLHSESIKIGLNAHPFVKTGFITLYSKIGHLGDARKAFDENSVRTLAIYSAFIGGFSQGGRALEAVQSFKDMMRCGLVPDIMAIVCVMPSCGILGDVGLALQLHKFILQIRTLNASNTLVWESIMDVYAKCGRIDLVENIFSRLAFRSANSWTSMITGYASQGEVRKALDIFDSMRSSRSRPVPSARTFAGVLSACARAGLVEEGKRAFKMMWEVYGIVPTVVHYGCLVDLLGRVGLVEEAKEVVERMPMEPGAVIWRCLLSSCEMYGDVGIGEWVVGCLHEIEGPSLSGFVCLSNIYAAKGMWKEVQRVREMMREIKIQNNIGLIPGCSFTASCA